MKYELTNDEERELNQELERSRRMIFVDDFTELGNGLTLFSGVIGREYASPSNARLFMRKGQRMEPDDFLHEQDLLIQEDGKAVEEDRRPGRLNRISAASRSEPSSMFLITSAPRDFIAFSTSSIIFSMASGFLKLRGHSL